MTARRSTKVLRATKADLERAGRLDTALGQQALVLARRLDEANDPGSALAAVAKELRTTLAEATKAASAVSDPVDELRARRERRLSGA